MEKENLQITKENYKGYLELFLKADTERTKKIKNLIHIFGISFLTAMILILFSNTLCVITSVGSTIYFCVNAKKIVQKYEIPNNIKEMYPYVDINIKYNFLYKKLIQNKIIKYENYEIVTYEEEYLNYVECEQIKKGIFKERLYETTIKESIISDKELEKAKIKVKKLIYPVPYRGRK